MLNIDIFISQVLDLSKTQGSENAIEDSFAELFEYMPIPHLDVGPPFLARARVNHEGEIFSKKGQLSYPPDPSKVGPGRANYAKQPFFYGALPVKGDEDACQWTALMETMLEHFVKDHTINRAYLTLSKWSITRPLRVSVLPFSKKSRDANGDFDELDKQFREIINKGWEAKKAIPLNDVYKGLEFVSDLFCSTDDRESTYRITSAYFNYIRKAFAKTGKPIEGLVYPSACTGTRGINIVMETELADSDALTFDFVVMMAMQRAPDNPKRITFPEVSNTSEPDENGDFRFDYIL